MNTLFAALYGLHVCLVGTKQLEDKGKCHRRRVNKRKTGAGCSSRFQQLARAHAKIEGTNRHCNCPVTRLID